ncbi:tRNA (adenine(22)-N(1))-methyltransferase [Vibrio splendidus]|uniref:tRNA (adenine(22)-N(1))-methyltransferase n=1 Tax=Vibrio splendidus TaxID=29497 RepID=UPI000CBEF485|nr:tRNA (adenine(22)-N(1))-methyltransferase TrmK [Vibrio splendidus]PMH02512.1 SAM-dependent methyltransferase [Vibrio splendidus]
MKLSNRLQTLHSLVSNDYQHIWDCCCDHGFLGVQLLSDNKAPQIHFVDIVPSLMNELEDKLTRYFPQDNSDQQTVTSQWQVYCMDVAAIPLQKHTGKHLVIIAGVGGDLTQKLVDDIHRQHPDKDIDFLLCPVHQQFELRSHLKALKFGLIEEVLIEENRRYYEILLVSNNQGEAEKNQAVSDISNVGDKIWTPSCDEQVKVSQQYKAKTLQHYLRIHQGQEKQGKPSEVKHIIDAYQAILR